MNKLLPNEVFGLLKTNIDAHTLGISTISELLRQCGYKTIISNGFISDAVENIRRLNNLSILKNWINENRITRIGFSYRLDPKDGKEYFLELFYQLKNNNLLFEDGGVIKALFFAGLPDTCSLIQRYIKYKIIYFYGDESVNESLLSLGVPSEKLPNDLAADCKYDNDRNNLAKSIIENGEYLNCKPKDHFNYSNFGKKTDSIIERINISRDKNTLPIIRAHVGPYSINKEEAINEFIDWTVQLSKSGYLDVLSIGTSQLTQSNFGEDWQNKPNGGGVPINSPLDYARIWEAARPMLVRTYAGTKDIQNLASIYEKYLYTAWHALSFWWFCELDGRGKNSLLENLKEHFDTIKYIASISKPLEANVSHHFSFRGADDITYILSDYLTAKVAKNKGIKYFILQNMLNTPKYTWGIQDLAKSRVLIKIIKELEDNNFKVIIQTRAGLDYFSPDYEKAKIQLASVTALMDDIEPNNINSPEIIHVVSYSEAVILANPSIIDESVKITINTLDKYRELRKTKKIEDMSFNSNVQYRYDELLEEVKTIISLLENNINNLYTPEGFYKLFRDGILPVPFLIDNENKFPKAKHYQTRIINGSVKTVDIDGNTIPAVKRVKESMNI